MKKQIITIAGAPGSGKSSTAKLVAQKLNFRHFSSGDFFRQIGLKLGISLNQVSKIAETDTRIDKMTDEEIRKLANENQIVIDSRLAFHWIPDSFKVFLDLPLEIAKDRIANDLKENLLRKSSEESSTKEEIYKKITDRLESEKKRYKELYNIDHTDKNNFDLVIDTNKNNLFEVVQIIISKYNEWIKDN
ncbi:MAG TPA: nucleoside monophosphate kinase [Candidatus Paceibacterota bacterium]|nr:nucleoside monophosphate kinase [Candidatus Paceibacterota bacterium]HPT18274.1 nucleoside monophosphate kinase [Candidatus Paceibacterota bacterium]